MTPNYIPNRRCSCPRCLSFSLFGAAIMVTLGLLLLLDNLHIVTWGQSWPFLLIVIGALKFAQNGAPIAGHVQPMVREVVMPQGGPSSPASETHNTAPSEVNRG